MDSLMTTILLTKEHAKRIYARYGTLINMAGKFLLALVTFSLINNNLTYMKILNNPFITLGISLICTFLPVNLIVFAAAVIVLLHLYAVALEIAAVTFLIMLVIAILYLRFAPKEALVILLTPIAFAFKIPYVIPLAMGLLGTPLSAVSVGCGVFIYYLIHYVIEYAPAVLNSTSTGLTSNISFFTEKLFQNKAVLLTLITFILIVLTVYAVKRLSVAYSWSIAVGSGALLNIMITLIGDFVFNINSSYAMLFLGTLLSAVIALILQVYVFSVDYTQTERVQFEDDEYYYYVKAIPKVSMTVADKKVKKINSRRYKNFGRRSSQVPPEEEDLILSDDTQPTERFDDGDDF